jgi:UDP-N-acetyl-D-mannosaminuronic acid dehydrogenase
VIGLGYIGLPTAAMFASKGIEVIGVDVSQHIVDTINASKIHIVEPELEVIVKKAVDEGMFKATIFPQPADVFLIAVPTPFLSCNKKQLIPDPDLSYIKAAVKSVAKVLKKGDLVILESTSPVGATEQVSAWLAELRTDLTFPQTHGEESDIRVAYCPERVLPGHVVRELVENDRVIGGMTKSCSEAAVELYKIFVLGDCVITNSRTAEMAKLTENASRDVSIAFANELSIISDSLEIDVWELISLANRHPRVNILQPGPGVGGHCIAVDPWFIVSSAPEQAKLIRTAREVNDGKPVWVIDKVLAALGSYLIKKPGKTVSDVTIACFGLSFKADIDDLRESPALLIVERLLQEVSCRILVVEPNVKNLPDSLQGAELATSSEAASKECDIALLLVDHKEFKSDLRLLLSDCSVIDTRGILNRT